jgi:hypothetical protein
LWGNCADQQGSQLWVAFGGHATIGCSCIAPGGVSGMEFITWKDDGVWDDPLFCDPRNCAAAPTAAGDYTLHSASPCLPPASLCHELIGALGAGCGVSGLHDNRDTAIARRDPGPGLRVSNPVGRRLVCTVSLSTPGPASLTLVSASGRKVAKIAERTFAAGDSRIEFNLSETLPNGWYLLVLEQWGRRSVSPVVRLR